MLLRKHYHDIGKEHEDQESEGSYFTTFCSEIFQSRGHKHQVFILKYLIK